MIATQAVTSSPLSSFGHFYPKNGPAASSSSSRLLQHLNPFNELLEFAINRFIKGHKRLLLWMSLTKTGNVPFIWIFSPDNWIHYLDFGYFFFQPSKIVEVLRFWNESNKNQFSRKSTQQPGIPIEFLVKLFFQSEWLQLHQWMKKFVKDFLFEFLSMNVRLFYALKKGFFGEQKKHKRW